MKAVELGTKAVGEGHPCYLVAEVGINHNGDLNLAKRLIDEVSSAGFDAVKFQKRDPDVCVPDDQKLVPRETPWGVMPYIDYKHRIEFGEDAYSSIRSYSAKRGIEWFVSVWDVPSVRFMERFDPIALKIPSAMLTNTLLLHAVRGLGVPIVLSTGMSNNDEIRSAVAALDGAELVLLHSTSVYPCPPSELNIRAMLTLREEFGRPTGYSGHETGLQASLAAAALGADMIERHVTMDRAMWGSDHAASLEPPGMHRLVRDVRIIEVALGDGVKRVFPSEESARKKLRGTT